MANYVKFTDTLNALPIKVSDEVKDYYANMPTSGVRPLQVKFAATHSGKVTRNNGFYLPHEMRAGVPSWTDQYQKPILLHHEDHDDAIGRVVSARYVDISTGIRNSYERRKTVDSARMTDKIITALVQGTLPFNTIIDVVSRYIINDEQLIEDPDFEGLGYIELTTAITDPDAIQKFLDGRYLTGSVGATTTKALCSVCRKDWATDELCEHRPGKSYEGKLCVLVAGKLKYEEYSVVNRPADTHSRAIEINVNGVQDFVQLDEITQGAILSNNIPSVTYSISVADSVEEGKPMAVENQDTTTTPEVKPEVVVEPKVEPVIEPVKDEVKVEEVIVVEQVVPVADVLPLEVPVVADETIPPTVDAIKDFWGTEYDEVVGDDPWGREYAEMMADAIQTETNPEKQKILRDAKLSSAQRKNLSASTFCGPDRSFPVPDCAHVTAARRLVGRYKGPGDKNKIMACVDRKATRLGCDKSKDEVGSGQFDIAYFDSYEDVDLVQLFNGVRAALVERKLDHVECQALMDELNTLRSQVGQSAENTKLTATQDELKNTLEELHQLQDQYANLLLQVRDAAVEKICLLKSLVEKDFSRESVVLSLTDKSLEDVTNMLEPLEKTFDVETLRDKITKDTREKPQVVVVDDPTLRTDNSQTDPVQVEEMNRKAIMQKYLGLKRINPKAAEQYMADMRSRNLIKG